MEDSLKHVATQYSTFNWTELLTLLLVVVTTVYTCINFSMMKIAKRSVETMNEQMEASLRPYIHFELKRYPGDLIYMHIRHSGKINAENLLLSLDKDFIPLGNERKENLKESFLFKHGVASFTPG